MEKRIIAIMLSIVMAAGGMGVAPALAAEADVQELVEAEADGRDLNPELSEDAETVEGKLEAEECENECTEDADGSANTENGSVENSADSGIDVPAETESETEMELEDTSKDDSYDVQDASDPAAAEENAVEGNTAEEISEEISEDASKYAAGEAANSITVTLDANGGSFPNASERFVYKYSDEYTVNGSTSVTYRGERDRETISVPITIEHTNSNLHFVGWSYSRNGDIDFVARSLPGSSFADIPAEGINSDNCTLYALWSEDILDSGYYSDTVTYIIDKNGVLTIQGTGKFGYSKVGIQRYYTVREVDIGEGITQIGDEAFSDPVCSELTRVSLPDSLKTIGNSAFSGCTKLTDISLPENLTTIGMYAFRGCSITNIRISGSIKEIGFGAFSSCTNLSNVTICEGVQTIDKHAFSGCENIEEISLPSSVTTIGETAFSECTKLKSITIPSNVDYISDSAFSKCSSLEKVILPDGLTGIDNWAFNKCTKLKSISIPSGVESISWCAFFGCSILEDVSISEGVRIIGESAFGGCTKLTEIIIPESVTTIEDQAFNGCFNLTKVVIPANVESIGELVFTSLSSGLTIYGYSGSYAEQYANENNIPFIDLNAHSIAGATVSGISTKTYTGKSQTLSLVVKDGNKLLKSGTDYMVTYKNNTNPGKATVTITGLGGYTGTITKTFLIQLGKTTRGDVYNLANNVKIEWKAVPGAKYYKVYRSGAKEPVIVTTGLVGWDKEPGLVNGQKYTYKIVASLTGKGDSSGDSMLSYSKVMYRLKTVVIRSVNNTEPGKVTVKYDKTTAGDSYVLQYCERHDMVGAKTKVVLGVNNTTYTIGGLKKGKNYYISIRVRKKVNGIDYYTTFGVPKQVAVTK